MKRILIILSILSFYFNVASKNNFLGIGVGGVLNICGSEISEVYGGTNFSPYGRIEICLSVINKYGPLSKTVIFSDLKLFSKKTEKLFEFGTIKFRETFKLKRTILNVGAGHKFIFRRITYIPYIGISFLRFKENALGEVSRENKIGGLGGIQIDKNFGKNKKSSLFINFSYNFTKIYGYEKEINGVGPSIIIGFKINVNPFKSKFEE